MTARSIIFAGLLVLVIALALLLLVRLVTPVKYPATLRLPDGSILKIVSISYGTNHSFAIPQRKPWKRFLVGRLPRSWTANLGWWPEGGSSVSSHQSEPSLAIFTICEMASSSSFSSSPMLSLCDAQGTIYDSAFEGATAGGFDGKHDWKLVCWNVSKFKLPVTQTNLTLRFSELSSDAINRRQVAEFIVANPLSGSRSK